MSEHVGRRGRRPDPAIEGLHHLQLSMPAGQEDAADAFYAEILGMKRIPKPEHLAGRGGCWFGIPDGQFHLGVEDPFSPARKAHPAFLVTGLNELRDRLETEGYEIVYDTQLEGHQRFYTQDPFGNRLELLEREQPE
ncbi:MAG: VOC family protein [Actinomycetota bacterium]